MRVTVAYVTVRRGAQRLRKAIRSGRGSGYICYAVRVADGAQRLQYSGIGDQSNNPGISLYFKEGEIVGALVLSRFLCSRKSCLCSNFRYTLEEGSAL